jgi:hypothetical protein
MVDAYKEGVPGKWKAFPGRRENGEDSLDAKKARGVPRSAIRARHAA